LFIVVAGVPVGPVVDTVTVRVADDPARFTADGLKLRLIPGGFVLSTLNATVLGVLEAGVTVMVTACDCPAATVTTALPDRLKSGMFTKISSKPFDAWKFASP
jgi:hypothetical protein